MHSINEKRFDFLKNMHFGVKNHFLRILQFLQICWSDLVGAIGVLKAVDMDLLRALARKKITLKVYFTVLNKGKTYWLVLKLF